MTDNTESYELTFIKQTPKAIQVHLPGDSVFSAFWLPKSQIEVGQVAYEEDFDGLDTGDTIEVYIPDWLAEEKELL